MELANCRHSERLSDSYIVKCVLLGNPGIGKSTLLNILTNNRFEHEYEATIGIDFATKTLTLPDYNNQKIKLQIWDTAGQERFANIVKGYLRDVYIAFLIFDMSDRNSWDKLTYWKQELENYVKYDKIPLLVLVGTKSDLKDQRVTLNEINYRAKEWNCNYHIVSAKEANAQSKISRIFSSAGEQFHQLIVYRHINGYELPQGIYHNPPDIIYDLNSSDEFQNKKSCCFQ